MSAKILVIEDNPSNRLLVKDILEFRGYLVIEAENGKEGIMAAGEHLPDLIFMDLQMPVMNGFEACRRIKDDPRTRHLKIVALTSFAMKGEQEKVMASGFDGYIPKPIDTRELPLKVEKFLEKGV
ncbi:MAG: response regulator [Deltaproteobacteria bacterium]|nr:response regulator [Deltaproteobacteria bacterium]